MQSSMGGNRRPCYFLNHTTKKLNMKLQSTTKSPYEFYGCILCVRKPFLVDEQKLVSQHQYSHYVDRGHFNVVRPGKGKGNYALIEFSSMRPEIKEQVIAIAPPITEAPNPLDDLISIDREAASFFANYRLPDGRYFTLEEQKTLASNAMILNACNEFLKNNFRMRTLQKWEHLSDYVNHLQNFTFDLPSTPKTLRRKFDQYKERGFSALIHGGIGNNNNRKVTDDIENLVLSLYTMKNKPFANNVLDLYLQFLGCAIDVVNTKTGELYNPSDFYKNNQPIVLSESTIWNIINSPENRVLVDKYRSDAHEFNGKHRPHHHRHAPQFSLSMISMDDRDLPRKMTNGQRVKAYYAYDVTSGVIVGASYSREKNRELFIDCMRDMLKFLQRNELGIPMEMQVEHHIVNQFKNDLMKAGVAFPFVKWCLAGNSQEKHAERFNRDKKYGYEKRYQQGIGRWYAKSEAYRTSVTKIFDEHNNTYKTPKMEYDTLVAQDLETVAQYNNDLHPNQKQYPGKTRMQVLLENANPSVARFESVVWARYVGTMTKTSIRRSQYVQVQNAKYQLPTSTILQQLEVNNLEVQAYWLPDEDGNISSVFLYQNDRFVCECEKIETYNTATSEQNQRDLAIIEKQRNYVSEFDQNTRERKQKISKVQILQSKQPEITQEDHDIIYQEPDQEDDIDYASLYDRTEYQRRALDSI